MGDDDTGSLVIIDNELKDDFFVTVIVDNEIEDEFFKSWSKETTLDEIYNFPSSIKDPDGVDEESPAPSDHNEKGLDVKD